MRVLILLFALLFSTVANAAPQRAILIDSSERALGTADNPIHTSGGGSSQWTTSGSDSTTNGNVGIGSVNPTAALDISSSGDSYIAGNLGVGSISPNATLDVSGSGDNYLAGNVGIGSLSPVKTLDVTGTIRATGNVGIGTINAPTALYVVGTGTFTGINIGIGTTSPTRLCVANNVIATCAP